MKKLFVLCSILLGVISAHALTSRTFCVTDYGAVNDGRTKCTAAFAKAIAACHAAGGGRVRMPAGSWFTGPIHFKSNVELHLEKGADIRFTDDPRDYLPAVHSSWEGLECLNYSPLVYAYGCTNIALTGKGRIGAKMDFWHSLMKEGVTDIQGARAILYKWGAEDYPVEKRVMPTAHPAVMRPQLVQFNRCRNVRMEGVRVEDSPFWTIHLFLCDGVVIRDIDVSAHSFNNDGVDIEMTRNVLIENSRFDQGDDCFVFKAGRNRDAWRIGVPTENVEIRNCRMIKGASLVGIGSELSGGIRNVYVHDIEVDGAYRLFYLKTNHRRGGVIENIRMENVTCGNVMKVAALETEVLYQWAVFPDYETRYTKIRNVSLKNVKCTGAQWGIDLKADAHQPACGFAFENVQIGKTENFLHHVENVEDVSFTNVTGGKVGKVEPTWEYTSGVR